MAGAQTAAELDLLARAHALFTGGVDPRPVGLVSAEAPARRGTDQTGATATAYRQAASTRSADLAAARGVDEEFARLIATAHRAHHVAHRDTAAVLAAARADSMVAGSPIAARELLLRRAARLRAQRSHVLAAGRRAARRRAQLRALRYRRALGRRPGDRRAEVAVRAALSRLGRPYVWGATGPDRFDCSGLVQWAYARAGIPLRRTTYQQIQDGIPVSPDQVRPGDLVFPHPGHVQLAIGNGLVVEAPQPGASVQVSRMGPSVAIRRPG
ncbi:MAG: NlpC/P60 family protein [Mycobacterium sp.]|nr:NlpC/P60 family protein [Mycobacterium sp.]